MDGLGTLRNLFCSGDCWSQFRVYLGGGFKYVFSIPIAGRFPFWLIFFKRIETTNQFWVMWSQNETKIIKTCGQPSMKQIRDSPHRPRKNEPCQPCQPWLCHRWISQPSRNESHQWSSLDLAKFNMRTVMKVTPYLGIHSFFGGTQKFFQIPSPNFWSFSWTFSSTGH